MQDEHCLVGYKSRGRTQQDKNVHSSKSSLTIQIYYFSINNARMEVTPLSPPNHRAGNLPTMELKVLVQWPVASLCQMQSFFSPVCQCGSFFFKKKLVFPNPREIPVCAALR